MKTVHIGFGHHIAIDDIAALISPDSQAMRRRIRGLPVINLCRGRRMKCLVLTKSGHVYLSALNPETIAGRIEGE